MLDDVSFTARQGEVTALIGPSGGGKSTACKLAARFWDVTGGKVLLGGTDVSTVDPETLLRSYSMVFQDVVLFRDTVMENIRLGRRAPPTRRCWRPPKPPSATSSSASCPRATRR